MTKANVLNINGADGKSVEIAAATEITLPDGSKAHVVMVAPMDAEGKVPGEPGYVGLTVQSVPGNVCIANITETDLIDNVYTVTGEPAKRIELINDGAVVVQLKHDASAATNGVPLFYDDGADNRLEATFPNSANNTFDGAYFSPSFNYYNLPGTVGSFYKQGDYGDVKLLAGGYWDSATNAGSRYRNTSVYR